MLIDTKPIRDFLAGTSADVVEINKVDLLTLLDAAEQRQLIVGNVAGVASVVCPGNGA